MTYKLCYLEMNLDHVTEYVNHSSLVTEDNVCLGRRVCRGKHWSSKWRDNIDHASTETPKRRVDGTVIGYVSEDGLVGENSGRHYNQVQANESSWCVVEWDNGKRSVYPIGAQGIYALAYRRV